MTNDEYYVADGWGDDLDSPSVEEMRKFLNKLDIDDPEHCNVWLNHTDSGWTVGCLPNNEVYFDNIDEQSVSPRHLTNVSRDKMLMLWQKLANVQIDEIEKETWLSGYTSEPQPPKPDPKDIYRDFWNVLINAERNLNLKCRAEECNEKTMSLSVFCPKHHFEMVNKIPCPFE